MFSGQIITRSVIETAHFPRSVPEPTARSFLRGYGFCIAMMLAFHTPAAAQEAGEAPAQFSDADMLRAETAREIARMEVDIAMIEWFTAHQEILLRLSRTDPEEAMRQRLPLYVCLASFLAPICVHLIGAFEPDAEFRTKNETP